MNLKKIFTTEVKIGLSFIAAITLIIYGINFLKGINLFTPSNHYYIALERVDGLVASNGVFVKGYKVGQVRDISYDFSKKKPFVIDIAINDDVHLPDNTIAYLFDESLLGEKGINLVFDFSNKYFSSGDTLPAEIDNGLIGTLTSMIPSIKSTIEHVDSLVMSVDTLINSKKLANTLSSMESTMANLQQASSRLNRMMDKDVPHIVTTIDSLSSDLRTITVQLKDVQFKDIFQSLDSSLTELHHFTTKINSTDGTIGMLLNDNALYNNLTSTMSSANTLLIDFQKNPKRYVHFSLFGRKEKKPQTNTADK